MEKVFLDTNIVIDLLERKHIQTKEQLSGYTLFYSPLSVHIFLYTMKENVPYDKITHLTLYANVVPFNQNIQDLALEDPTSDFEDNVQLHSAVDAECDLFLTNDKKLLDMKLFGEMRLARNV